MPDDDIMILMLSEAWSLPDLRLKQGFPFGSDLAARLTLRRPGFMYGSMKLLYGLSLYFSKEHIMPGFSFTRAMRLNESHIHVHASGHVRS